MYSLASFLFFLLLFFSHLSFVFWARARVITRDWNSSVHLCNSRLLQIFWIPALTNCTSPGPKEGEWEKVTAAAAASSSRVSFQTPKLINRFFFLACLSFLSIYSTFFQHHVISTRINFFSMYKYITDLSIVISSSISNTVQTITRVGYTPQMTKMLYKTFLLKKKKKTIPPNRISLRNDQYLTTSAVNWSYKQIERILVKITCQLKSNREREWRKIKDSRTTKLQSKGPANWNNSRSPHIWSVATKEFGRVGVLVSQMERVCDNPLFGCYTRDRTRLKRVMKDKCTYNDTRWFLYPRVVWSYHHDACVL